MQEEELLALLFGCERFCQCIYSKKVRISSDRKPLKIILKKTLSSAPLRRQRKLLRLQKYYIKLSHKASEDKVGRCIIKSSY